MTITRSMLFVAVTTRELDQVKLAVVHVGTTPNLRRRDSPRGMDVV